jgi:2-phosphoglycerate kinase
MVFRKRRPFDVLLVGGASGTGKSTIAYELRKHFDLNIVQVDDFQCVVEHVTKEIDYPVFHYWSKHFEEAVAQPLERKLETTISYANALSAVLEVVVHNHLEEDRPMILEGDFIAPELCKRLLADDTARGRVKCVFITENSQVQIAENYRRREGSPQHDRAALSHRFDGWLREQAAGSPIMLIESRPWRTTVQRIRTAMHRRPHERR